jgi:1-acyl-sn-glycerol-3-phosphate acyltransferase
MKPFYYITRLLLKGIGFILYRHKVYGTEHFIEGGAIIAPNHASFLDPPIIAVSWPEEIYFLGRQGLFERPILRTLIRHLNTYPVSGTFQDLGSLKLVFQLLREQKKVVIFPEGRRSEDGKVADIKSGIGMLAQRSQCPIIPTYIHGSYDVWNRRRPFPRLWGKTACVFGPPIYWERFKHFGKKEAQEAIAVEVKESIEKLRRWYEAGAKGIPG